MLCDLTTRSLRILLRAWPMWISPLAYGGPSCSRYSGAPLRALRIRPYRSISSQRATISGSVVCRFAFIEKDGRGRLQVSFQSAIAIRLLYAGGPEGLRARGVAGYGGYVVRETTLDNGLKVLIREVHTAPLASVWCWYRVGSKDEGPGVTGVSHWCEHMNFKGTKNIPRDQVKGIIEKFGGTWNGYT